MNTRRSSSMVLRSHLEVQFPNLFRTLVLPDGLLDFGN